MQHEISWKQLKEIQTSYEWYQKKLSGANRKLIAGAATTAAVTAATGGLAVAFAPQIAVVLAGGSFAGLSGAALTSASLAAIGGGALTAGGLGMAGGTAIIAGGGVLIGLTGSCTISLTAGVLLQSKGFVLHECAKLLAFWEFALSKTSYECQLESEPRARLILSHLCSFESEPPKHRSSNNPDGRSPHSYQGHRIWM